jgi:hypothetical protein
MNPFDLSKIILLSVIVNHLHARAHTHTYRMCLQALWNCVKQLKQPPNWIGINLV